MYTNIDNKQKMTILSIDNLIYIILLSIMSITFTKKYKKFFKGGIWNRKIR